MAVVRPATLIFVHAIVPSYTIKNLPWVHSFDCFENRVFWEAFALIMGLLCLRCESLLYVGEEILPMATDECTLP